MKYSMTFMLAPVLALASCDPSCPGVVMSYPGRAREGDVIVLFQSHDGHRVNRYPDVASALAAWNGSCLFGGVRAYSRSQLEAGATLAAWVDVNRDDFAACSPTVTAECAPDAIDPRGSVPAPPYGDTIPLEIRDPD